jgi:hypothetical protein
LKVVPSIRVSSISGARFFFESVPQEAMIIVRVMAKTINLFMNSKECDKEWKLGQ